MKNYKWVKVLESSDELAEGRVMTVTAENKDYCLAHYEDKFCALDNKCPHQGGPLGEGSIENGLLRCPWHGWDYEPCSGKVPGYDDGVETFETKVENGSVFIKVEPKKEHVRNISDVMVETMVNWGVDTVFGMVGHSNLGLADAMQRQEVKGNLRFFGIRHEGAASFACSAYGKLLGRPAACFTIAGPGATNLYTGLWDAKVDRAPLLALTGQVDTQVVGTGNFQELDLVQAFSTVADFNHRVQVNSRHGELMSLAIKNALLKRDVSHLTFPDEVQVLPSQKKAKNSEQRVTLQSIAPPQKSMDEALALLKNSKRPVIIVGHGAKWAMTEIITMAEKLNIPVITTFKGKGLISDSHPLAGGVLGRSGTPVASWLMNESDCLLVLGASFSKHTGITPKIPTIQVDFDPMALAKHHKVDVQLWGEVSVTVKLLTDQLTGNMISINQREDVSKRWKIWKAEKAKRLLEDRGEGISSISIFDALNQFAPSDAVMCVDVGNNAYSFGRYYESKNNSFLMSGYLGSIGFALPASLGAWAAVGQNRPIIAVTGDGGLGQYLAEISTLVKYNMNVKVIVINNGELGKISKEQRAGNYDVWKTHLHNPNFSDFAQSCGAVGIRVDSKQDLYKEMELIMKIKGPALIECMADVKLI